MIVDISVQVFPLYAIYPIARCTQYVPSIAVRLRHVGVGGAIREFAAKSVWDAGNLKATAK